MGGDGGKYRTSRVLKELERLAISSGKFRLEQASKEGYKLKPLIHSGISYPIPTKHRTMSIGIVREAGKRMELWGVCSKDEFLENVK